LFRGGGAEVKTKGVCLILPVPVFADPDEFAGTEFRFHAGVEELVENIVSFGESAGGDEGSRGSEAPFIVHAAYRFAGEKY
jgi:hypothetical protein